MRRFKVRYPTLRKAKRFVKENQDPGCICPVCGRTNRTYVRELTSGMVRGLLEIYNDYRKKGRQMTTWIHFEDYLNSRPDLPSSLRGDIHKLRFWGLIEKMRGDLADGNPNTGYYRITHLGTRFLGGQVRIAKSIRVYRNKPSEDPGAELITVHEALGIKFNYSKTVANED